MIWNSEILRHRSAKYSDEEYLDKDECTKIAGSITNLSSIWVAVSTYRKNFKFELALKTPSYQNLCLHLTPTIYWKISEFEKTLLNFKNSNYNNQFIDNALRREIFMIIKLGYSENITLENIHDILNNPDSYSQTEEEALTKNLYSIFKGFSKIQDKNFTCENLKKWWVYLNPDNKESMFRTVLLKNKKNQAVGFSIKEIESKFYDFNLLEQQKNFSNFLKAVVGFYYLLEGRFFSKHNDILAITYFYYSLYREFGDVVYLLELVNFTQENKAGWNKSLSNTLVHNDLNYVFLLLIKGFKNKINLIKESTIKEESIKPILSKEKLTDKLRQLFPELSKMQAAFIIEYFDPSKNYTLQNFIDLHNSSYETSRYSLDKLVALGFYSKVKISKKFVFKPIYEKINFNELYE